MTTDLDIYRSTHALIQQHGEELLSKLQLKPTP
jgi:hypothetical protein